MHKVQKHHRNIDGRSRVASGGRVLREPHPPRKASARMDLFSPVTLGDLHLPNRVVMAPLTRLRVQRRRRPRRPRRRALRAARGPRPDHHRGHVTRAPSRASYPGQPGIVTAEQVEGWRRVADAVHAEGGRIVMQLMNGGRVSHTDITGTDRIVAPSAIAIEGEVRARRRASSPYPVPHALTTDELATVRDEFVAAARNAIEAGLDGVELHAANGYLLHEFLSPVSNQRDDALRRIARGPRPLRRRGRPAPSPRRSAPDASASASRPPTTSRTSSRRMTPRRRATYEALVDGLAPLGLAYLSVLHADPAGELVQDLRAPLRRHAHRQQRLRQRHHARRGRSRSSTTPTPTPSPSAASPSRTPTSSSAGRASTRRERAEPGDRSTAPAPRATPTTRASRADPLR